MNATNYPKNAIIQPINATNYSINNAIFKPMAWKPMAWKPMVYGSLTKAILETPVPTWAFKGILPTPAKLWGRTSDGEGHNGAARPSEQEFFVLAVGHMLTSSVYWQNWRAGPAPGLGRPPWP